MGLLRISWTRVHTIGKNGEVWGTGGVTIAGWTGVGWLEKSSRPSTIPCHVTDPGYLHIVVLRLTVTGLVHREWTLWIFRAAGIHRGLIGVDPIL